MNHTIKHRKNGDFKVVCASPEKDTPTERCILCGIQTSVPVSTDVSLRNNYVDGAGQMCFLCFDEVYAD
jgi:hypothetical protein